MALVVRLSNMKHMIEQLFHVSVSFENIWQMSSIRLQILGLYSAFMTFEQRMIPDEPCLLYDTDSHFLTSHNKPVYFSNPVSRIEYKLGVWTPAARDQSRHYSR